MTLARSTMTEPTHSTPDRVAATSAMLEHGLGDGKVVVQAAPCNQSLAVQRLVVLLHRLLGAQVPAQHRAHETHQVALRLRLLDLAPEQGNSGTVALRLVQQLEGVSRRPRRPTEDADHQTGVMVDELLQCVWPVERHLEKQWPLGARQARQGPDDAVVDEGTHAVSYTHLTLPTN